MSKLLEKGVKVPALLASNLFSFAFDYDEWPSTHTDGMHYVRAFNSSIFDLRYCYRDVFPEKQFAPIDADVSDGDDV